MINDIIYSWLELINLRTSKSPCFDSLWSAGGERWFYAFASMVTTFLIGGNFLWREYSE